MKIKNVVCCAVCDNFEDSGMVVGSCSKGECSVNKCKVLGNNVCCDFEYSLIMISLYIDEINSKK